MAAAANSGMDRTHIGFDVVAGTRTTPAAPAAPLLRSVPRGSGQGPRARSSRSPVGSRRQGSTSGTPLPCCTCHRRVHDLDIDLQRSLLHVNLAGLDLSGASLNERNLASTDLRSTDLSWAELRQANLASQARGAPISSRPISPGPDLDTATRRWRSCRRPSGGGPTCSMPTSPGRTSAAPTSPAPSSPAPTLRGAKADATTKARGRRPRCLRVVFDDGPAALIFRWSDSRLTVAASSCAAAMAACVDSLHGQQVCGRLSPTAPLQGGRPERGTLRTRSGGCPRRTRWR